MADLIGALTGRVLYAIQPISWPWVHDLLKVTRQRHPGIEWQVDDGTTHQIVL